MLYSRETSYRQSAQKGFTLVEIAIVLVIIGLLLGGIIKGREMIANTKLKQLIAMSEEVAAAIRTYEDKYGALPGDDPNASVNLSGGVGGCVADDIDDGNGNGLMEESFDVVEHLACANLIKGSFNGSSDFMFTPYGGQLIVVNFSLHGYGSNGIVIYGLAPDIAKRLDATMDDGIYNTGAIRATEDYTKVQAVGYFY